LRTLRTKITVRRSPSSEWKFVLVPKLSRTFDGWVGSIIIIGLLVLIGIDVFKRPSNVIPWLLILLVFANFPAKSVNFDRHRVSRIVSLSYWVIFVGRDGKKVGSSRPYWTSKQLRELADFMQVPIEIRSKWTFALKERY
jgi:hypothetical protein